jgi:ABC-type sugar transport system substrate-binding protein
MTSGRRRWLVLPATLALLLAACTGGSATAPSAAPATTAASEAPASEAPSSAAPPEAIKLGFVTHVLGNPFIQQIVDGAEAAAADLNVELQVVGPEDGSAETQLQLVDSLVASGVQGIATSVPGE